MLSSKVFSRATDNRPVTEKNHRVQRSSPGSAEGSAERGEEEAPPKRSLKKRMKRWFSAYYSRPVFGCVLC